MDIAFYSIKAVAYAITDPYLAVLLVFLAFILYRQNKKTTVMQKMIIGEEIDSPLELTISQIVIGIFAGVVGAVILSYLGVIFDEQSAVDLIFLISIVLMFWSPRFMCFSYSAAILGAFSLILSAVGYVFRGTVINVLGTQVDLTNLDFLKIDIVAIMTAVAVLHFIEGFLVIVDGKRGAIPVFSSRDNKIIGGFAMQRYWVIPIALLIMTRDKSMAMAGEQIMTPDWWPLVYTSIPMSVIKAAVVIFYPIYGIVGYSSVTFTKNKREKTLISGGAIIAYSILLFGIAQLGRFGIAFQVLALIFAPAAHEFMIRAQRNLEQKGKAKYVGVDDGIMVLEVAPKSVAFNMGVKTGDIILEVNNEKVKDEKEMMSAINNVSSFIWLKVRKPNGNIEQYNSESVNNDKKLGIVYVPKNIPSEDMVVKIDGSKFQEVLDKIRNNKHHDEENIEGLEKRINEKESEEINIPKAEDIENNEKTENKKIDEETAEDAENRKEE